MTMLTVIGVTNQELVEMAAKATGRWSETDPSNGMLRGNGTYWNPLINKEDAFSMLVQLRLHLGCEDNCVSCWSKDDFGNFQTDYYAHHGEEGAAMRAITRAAVCVYLKSKLNKKTSGTAT